MIIIAMNIYDDNFYICISNNSNIVMIKLKEICVVYLVKVIMLPKKGLNTPWLKIMYDNDINESNDSDNIVKIKLKGICIVVY